MRSVGNNPGVSDDRQVRGELDRLELNDRAGGVRLNVHVRPRSSRSAVLGVREGALEVAVTAPPADGAANSELCKVLARALGVRASGITIVAGASGRHKIVEIGGLSATDARQRLGGTIHGVRMR